MELPLKDRLILHNQYLILEKLYTDEAETYRRYRAALMGGYARHYSDFVQGFDDELSEEASREVLDILQMHDTLKRSYAALVDNSGIDENDIRFRGFDGNNETHLMAYTRYFITGLGHYDEFGTGDFNSHRVMLPVYRRMLAEWEKSADKNSLTKNDIERITAARTHPDSREAETT